MSLESGDAVPLDLGTLVLLPAGIGYGFEAGTVIHPECDGARAIPKGKEGLKIFRAGEGDAQPLVVACGEIVLANDEAVSLLAWLNEPIVVRDADLLPSGHALQAVFIELRDGKPVSLALIETLLKGLLIRVLDLRSDASATSLAALLHVTDRQLALVLEAILTRPAEPITADALAACAGMSRTLLFQRFRAAFGMSPMRFVCDMRLARAARMLSEGSRQIGDIARANGFRSRSHFSREFKRKYGQTPGEFRAHRS